MSTKPMAMHKNVIIGCLARDPEDVAEICPGYEGTAEEAIAELKAADWEWLVNGECLTDEELQARNKPSE